MKKSIVTGWSGHRRRLVAVAAAASLSCLAAPAHASTRTPVATLPAQITVASLAPGHSHIPVLGELSGTAAVSPSDVWAVGGYPFGGAYVPLAEHWDGHAWTRVPTPEPAGTRTSYLLAVTAVSADDVWAAGADVLSDGITMRTLIEHWNGRAWHLVASPSLDGDWNMLNGIDAVAADDVWVVGDGGTDASISTLVEHWDGHRWKIVPSPNVTGVQVNQLNQVTAVSADDIWTVGYDAVLGVQYSTLAEHWNGHRWKVVKTPNLHDPNFDLQAVTAVATDEVWAVGSYWSNDEQRFNTLAERWDGDRWTVVPSPNPKAGSNGTFSLAVSAGSGSDVWSSGWYEVPGGNEVPLMEHWNGHRWQLSTTPDVPDTPYSNLIGLAAMSASDAWAIGSFQYAGQWCTLYEHWDGHQWQVVPHH